MKRSDSKQPDASVGTVSKKLFAEENVCTLYPSKARSREVDAATLSSSSTMYTSAMRFRSPLTTFRRCPCRRPDGHRESWLFGDDGDIGLWSGGEPSCY